MIDDDPVFEIAEQCRKRELLDEAAIGWLYVAALERQIDLTRGERSDGSTSAPVLQDSTILLRSWAYHLVLGTPKLPERLESLATLHPKFDLSIVLTASRKTRLMRLEKRRPENIRPEDLLVRDDWGRFLAMETALMDAAGRWFGADILETDDMESHQDVARAYWPRILALGAK